MSSRFIRGENPQSPSAERGEADRPHGTEGASKHIISNTEGHLSSLGPSLTAEDSAIFVRNVAEVAAAAATLAVRNSQSPQITPQATPRGPPIPLSVTGPSPKFAVPETSEARGDWDHGDTDNAQAGMGGHDAPNWSRTKSSMILLGATILYAIIAGTFIEA
jgi:Ca2+:H+ antiporter